MAKKINYYSRNFADVRQELIWFVKQYYPDIFNDFNDASVGMMLLELNAAVGDMLSFQTDRMFQETQIDFAHFMLSYTFIKLTDSENTLDELESAKKYNIKNLLNNNKISIPDNIDKKIYECIRANKLIYEKDYLLREEIIIFSEHIKHLQHYLYHNNEKS